MDNNLLKESLSLILGDQSKIESIIQVSMNLLKILTVLTTLERLRLAEAIGEHHREAKFKTLVNVLIKYL